MESQKDIVCSLLGHNLVCYSSEIENKLFNTLEMLILEKDVNCFYVGMHGSFDKMAQHICFVLKQKYEHIKYYIVLTSPTMLKMNKYGFCKADNYDNTIMFDIENIHFKARIKHSVMRMVQNCVFLVCYYDSFRYHSAIKYAYNLAKKLKKQIYNLAKNI